MMAMDKKNMTDKELDTLLAQAGMPTLPKGFADRLQAKLEDEHPSNVIAFPQRRQIEQPARRIWLSALPLAASLVLGLYWGATGTMPTSLQSLETALLSNADSAGGIGTEDTEEFLNGDVS
jgi:hypothetical protein